MGRSLMFVFLATVTLTSMKAQDKTLKIWTDGVPGAISNPSYQEISEVTDILRIRNVTDPTISVYFPSREKANGTAVVICPGGGYGILAYEHEGIEIAKWFNSIGVTGVVLKYRLPSDKIMRDKSTGPLQDAQEALRIVRRNARQWNLNPNKIGIMGFSAGGHLASTLSTHYNEKVYEVIDTTSARPSFSILIYPVISFNKEIYHGGSCNNLIGKDASQEVIDHFSNELQVTRDTPPAFLVHALDDNAVPVQNSINYLFALKKNGVAGELHIYEKGGHGFGIRKVKGTEAGWTDALNKWMMVNKLL